jgi:predicted lipoprotein with Yx(FWY)xxD motif
MARENGRESIRAAAVASALLALLLLPACGETGPDGERPSGPARGAGEQRGSREATGASGRDAARGTVVTVRNSEFGRMLFGANRQAIYVFERDRPGRSRCYGECAEAWPPVLTDGQPRAGAGARASLLGTTRRRDGKRQVTYAGKPLYFYANEGPGEVRCHNVELNGGLWWVVGPDGKRRP